MQMLCLLEIVPTELEDHLELNARTINTYALMKAETVKYVEQHLSRQGGATRMDIDGMFEGHCFTCGQFGHRSAECPCWWLKRNPGGNGKSGYDNKGG